MGRLKRLLGLLTLASLLNFSVTPNGFAKAFSAVPSSKDSSSVLDYLISNSRHYQEPCQLLVVALHQIPDYLFTHSSKSRTPQKRDSMFQDEGEGSGDLHQGEGPEGELLGGNDGNEGDDDENKLGGDRKQGL
ncbi:hypothetical protein BT69DRAFT_1300602 [Atractiella rhizophila]|nr:hypothetical protein BT69DRAFT_1300602 [Atractiella rhizophila]